MAKIYFSDFFEVSPETLETAGALNISLINDLPLFIDPFLIFHSNEPEIQELHQSMIKYMKFLRNKALLDPPIDKGLHANWFKFKEVKQTWLGFSFTGNNGKGLGKKFADSLYNNLRNAFKDFGYETISHGSHLERLCLIEKGVGKDNISDFCTVLIKEYLLEFTQSFVLSYIDPKYLKEINVKRVRFNYKTEAWEDRTYTLPFYIDDHVLLTPRKLLTKKDLWLNQDDMLNKVLGINGIAFALENEELRALVNNYYRLHLPIPTKDKKITASEKKEAKRATIRKFPELIDYYIRLKEETGDEAEAESSLKVDDVERIFINQLGSFIEDKVLKSSFYSLPTSSRKEIQTRLLRLKNLIEDNNSQRIFYRNDEPITTEDDLKRIFILIWRPPSKEEEIRYELPPFYIKLASNSQLNKRFEEIKQHEPSDRSYLRQTMTRRIDKNDLKSICLELDKFEYDNLPDKGVNEQTVELLQKLHLRRQLPTLVRIGKKLRPDILWEPTKISEQLTVIVYFSNDERQKMMDLLDEYELLLNPNIILVDGRLEKKSSEHQLSLSL